MGNAFEVKRVCNGWLLTVYGDDYNEKGEFIYEQSRYDLAEMFQKIIDEVDSFIGTVEIKEIKHATD